jgi:hypothetical protein
MKTMSLEPRPRYRRDRRAERPNDESRSATISIARQGVAGFRFVASSPSLRDKSLNCESVDAMAKKPNGRGWPLEYDRRLIELARATNSLESSRPKLNVLRPPSSSGHADWGSPSILKHPASPNQATG